MLVSQGAGPSATIGPYTGPPAAPHPGGAPTPTPTVTHTSTPVGGIQPVPGGTTVPAGTPTGGGFAGTPTQSAAAAYVAGLNPNSTDWQTAVSTANANNGTIPGVGGAPTSTSSAFNPSTVFDTDPAALWAKEQEQLGIPRINTDLQSLIDRIVGAYGDPSIASEAGFGLDPQGAAFAQQNYLSGNATLARIDAAHKQNQQKIINTLAGHGLVFSGDTGYQTGLEDRSYGNNVYDAQQQALTNIINAITAAQQQKDALHQARVNADESAWQNYISNPAYWGNANGLPSQDTSSASAPQPSVTAHAPNVGAVSNQVQSAAKQAAASVVQKVASAAKKKTLPNAYATGQKAFG